jgi:polyphosphate kinase 2 (PPK2 family)
MMAAGIENLAKMQDKLYAHDEYSVLIVFQAMDAAGKDGSIKHYPVHPKLCQQFFYL